MAWPSHRLDRSVERWEAPHLLRQSPAMVGGEFILPGGVAVALAQSLDVLGLSGSMLRSLAAHGHVHPRWARSRDDLRQATQDLPCAPEPEWDELHLPILRKPPFPETESRSLDYHGIRLLRDGWRPVIPPPPASSEEMAAWARLGERSVYRSSDRTAGVSSKPAGREPCDQKSRTRIAATGCSRTFTIVSPSRELCAEPSWEWADFDDERGRVVWTEDCCLFAATITGGRRGDPTKLLDTREMRFERRVAPY